MKALSDIVEDALEVIKPGSRQIGGPSLPKTGDTTSSDYLASSIGAPPADSKEKVLGATEERDSKSSKDKGDSDTTKDKADLDVAKDKAGSDTTKDKAIAAKAKKEPKAKAKATPNPLGASVPLTAEKFQRLVTMTRDPWFIKFYAPWCSHCQAMAPNWIQLSKEMKGRLNIGEVNCDAEPRLCKDVKLRGYPTILFFRGGERVEYEGLRGLGDFISYANKAIDIGDGVKDVTNDEFKALEEKEEVIFLYFYDHATTSEDFEALERLTLSLVGHAKLVKTNSPELAERYKITTFPRLIVSRDGLPTYYTALAPQDMRDFRQVLHWMKSVWLPIVPELTASNSRDIMDGRLVVLGILSRDRPDDFEIAKKELKNAAMEWIDKETANFQRQRQELRDSKQLRIEEAEDRDDQRALRNAKSIRITMDKSDHKEVGFAWVDGVFWERWIRQTYGIDVSKDGEKVIINDEDVCSTFILPLQAFH
jgi:protein disulfide-isomerase